MPALKRYQSKSRQALQLRRRAGASPHDDNCNTPAKGSNHRFDTHSLPHLPFGSIALPGAIPCGPRRLSDAGCGGQLRIRPEIYRGSLRHCRQAATLAGLSDLSQVTSCLLWVFLDVFQPCEYHPWGRPRFQQGEEGKVLRLRLTHLFRRFAGLSALAPSENDLAQDLCAFRHATRDPSSSTGATLFHFWMPRFLWIT